MGSMKRIPLRGSENGNRYSPTGREVKTGVTRQLIDVTAPRPEQIDIRDIARSLARQERFTGHCPMRPTVARHSVAVMHIGYSLLERDSDVWVPAKQIGNPVAAAMRALLMHDAPEFLVSDLNGAVKQDLRPILRGAALRASDRERGTSRFDRLETAAEFAIAGRYNCAIGPWEELVHEADTLACAYEMKYDEWEPRACPPQWLLDDVNLAHIYGLMYGFRSPTPDFVHDGGEASFLIEARKLGMK